MNEEFVGAFYYTPIMLDGDGVAFNLEQSYESSGFGKLAASQSMQICNFRASSMVSVVRCTLSYRFC